MEACFIEIYNETLRDLLSSPSKEEKHDIRIDPKNQGEVYVTNLTPVTITSHSQVRDCCPYRVYACACTCTL